jgi:hypothetical protein
MAEAFYCLDCRQVGELTQHGACGTCGSQAVAHPVSYGDKKNQRKEVGETRRNCAVFINHWKAEASAKGFLKAAQEAKGSQGNTRTLVGRGKENLRNL